MASPWTPPQSPPAERPWMGIALLVAIPLISLILIRMLWSVSGLWFLSVGIILLGAAAVFFMAGRPQGLEYDRETLGQAANRVPIILAALGIYFLAMLLLPNLSGGSGTDGAAQQQSPGLVAADEADSGQPPPAGEQNVLGVAPPAAPAGDQTYLVQSGDTVWEIANRFGTSVQAIVEANDLENPADLQVGQELVIPSAEDEAALVEEEDESADVAPP